MNATFSPAMQAALDRFDVPALPDGFADRLVARATAEAAVERKPAPRRRTSTPWKRASRIIGSIGAVGFLSATAAAMGAFGEPVEIPVISDVARELHLVEERAPKPRVITDTPKAAIDRTAEIDKESETVATGNVARQTLDTVFEHPRFDGLKPRQKLNIIKRESKRLVRSGTASREDVKSALIDIRQKRREADEASGPQNIATVNTLKQRIANATPEQKAKLRDRLEAMPADRQQDIKEQLGRGDIVADTEPAAEAIDATETPAIQITDNLEPLETPAALAQPLPTVRVVRQERIDQLKERLGRATPEQRATLREQLQQRRDQSIRRQQLRDRRAKLRRRRN